MKKEIEYTKDQLVAENQELRLEGRILYLTKDPTLIKAQISGLDLGRINPKNLMDGVSTDQIIPSRWCMAYSDPENLGKYLLTGVEGINIGDLKGKFKAIVVGVSFGRGSSREHAQLAFKGAGIELLIAESFETIFADNCRNYQIYMLNNDRADELGVLDGRVFQKDQIINHFGQVSRDISRFGGLIPYTKARIEGKVDIPTHNRKRIGPMTIAEKVIARNTRVSGGFLGVLSVKPGEEVIVKSDKKYAYELQTIVSQQVLNDTFGLQIPIKFTDSTWLFEDHLALMPPDLPVTNRHRDAQRAFAEKYGIPEYRAGRDGVEGICHTVMLEKHVLPGELVLGNDSHTCHLGVVNALAVGKGASEFAAALITGDVPIKVPETIRIILKGKLKEGISTTDAMLSIISRPDFKDNIASGKVLQFGGAALDEISVDDQATFTNMSIEGQAFTGIVEPNKQLLQYMMQKHNIERMKVLEMFVYPDAAATYFDEIELDLGNVERMAALPGDTQNGVPLSEVKGTKVKYFYIGSCKNGDINALRRAAKIYKGRRIAEGVIVQIQANTRDVEDTLRNEGVLDVFKKAGVEVIGRGCGPCMGATEDANEREEMVLSATDRNFEGRMGKRRKVILASDEVVAASSIKGEVCAPEDLPLID